jgi:hypothetical protein
MFMCFGCTRVLACGRNFAAVFAENVLAPGRLSKWTRPGFNDHTERLPLNFTDFSTCVITLRKLTGCCASIS